MNGLQFGDGYNAVGDLGCWRMFIVAAFGVQSGCLVFTAPAKLWCLIPLSSSKDLGLSLYGIGVSGCGGVGGGVVVLVLDQWEGGWMWGEGGGGGAA